VAIFIRFLQNNGNILFKVPFDASRRLAKENAFRFHRVPSEKHALFGLAKEQVCGAGFNLLFLSIRPT